MLELLTVAGILCIIGAVATPTILTMVHSAKLKGTTSDFSGLVQASRIRAVQDDRFYSVYILGNEGFVDIYPQSNTGASGSGGTSIDYRDPVIFVSSEVIAKPAASAPNASNLQSQFLPAGSGLTVNDGSPGTATPITFGPRGLPCITQAVQGGTVCDSTGGPTAYWVFFQDSISSNWQAVTVSPAGRIRKWYYSNGAWNSI